MSFESIQERMRTPWSLSPREIVESYLYLVSVYGQKTLEFVNADGRCASLEGEYLRQDMTSAKAKALVRLTESGQSVSRLKAELAVIQETIRALKRAQQYMSEESRHQV